MKNVKIYFVLYIVLLCEIFIVILDRDEAISKLKPLLIKGIYWDFELAIPNNILDLSIFSTTQINQAARSDTIKTIVEGKSFVATDKNIKFFKTLVKAPKFIDTNYLFYDIMPVTNDSISQDYIFIINYDGPRISGSPGIFDTCEIEITCKLDRLITAEIKHKIKENGFDNEKYSIGKYESFSSTKRITVIFNRTYFRVQC
jgi:hypothetical protein